MTDSLTATPALPSKKLSSADRKKIATQQETLQVAKTLIQDLVMRGIANLDTEQIAHFDHPLQQMKAGYLGGLAREFKALFLTIQQDPPQQANALDRLAEINLLITRLETYLAERLASVWDTPDLETPIEDYLDRQWRIDSLIQQGRTIDHAELIQFCFFVHEQVVYEQYVDEAFWLEKTTGRLFKTENKRSTTVKSKSRPENSTHTLLKVPQLVLYPGTECPPVRWKEAVPAELTAEDYQAFQTIAHRNYAALIKSVKQTMIRPYGSKNPVYVVQGYRLFRQENFLQLCDAENNSILLQDIPYFSDPFSPTRVLHKSTHLLEWMCGSDVEALSIALMFHADTERQLLVAKPLALIAHDKIIRLVY